MFIQDDITVIFAGAGCGKTTYLKEQVKKELSDALPEEIAFISFTRKGANEGKDRIMKETKIPLQRFPYFKTLNALTFSALGYETKNIFNKKWAAQFNKLLGFNLTLNKEDECNTQDDKYLSVYDMERHGFIPYSDAVEMTGSDGYKRFVSAYTEFKGTFNLFDYNDCLANFVERGEPLPVKIAFIDEAQDLTYLHWNVCYLAFSKAERIYVAGDDYQSIYTYAGARPHVFLDMAKKAKVVKLEKSYRLPEEVYSIAHGITEMIEQKMEKDYLPVKVGITGSVEFVDNRNYLLDKIQNDDGRTWLCLFRNNYFTADFCRALREKCIPFHNDRGFCISEKGIAKIRKYENMRKEGFRSPEVIEEFKKEYNIRDFNDDISESDLFQGDDKYFVQGYMDLYGAERLSELAKKTPRVFVSTIHKVKGAEADNVIVFLDCTRKVARNKFVDFDSELRLLYVAFTRAKRSLYIARSRSAYGLDDIVDTIYNYNRG